MARRRHRKKRNPLTLDNTTLLWVGGGLAVAGLAWIWWQNQGPPPVLNSSGQPVAPSALPVPPSNILALGADAVAFYQQCGVNGAGTSAGTVAACTAATIAQFGSAAVTSAGSALTSVENLF
jgi:hypothetical protein